MLNAQINHLTHTLYNQLKVYYKICTQYSWPQRDPHLHSQPFGVWSQIQYIILGMYKVTPIGTLQTTRSLACNYSLAAIEGRHQIGVKLVAFSKLFSRFC